MKKLLLVCFVLFAFAAVAQVEETLKNAARNKLESQDFNSQRSNKERNMMDNDKKKRSAPSQSHPAPPPAPGSAAPEPADSTATEIPADAAPAGSEGAYTFGQKITYEMDDPSKPDEEKTEMTYYYGDNALMSFLTAQKMAMIYDFGAGTVTTIDETDKTATILSARWLNKEMEKAAAADDITVTKTGQTKTILGYTCEEYIIEDPKSKVVCWVTTQIPVDYSKMQRVMSKGRSKAYPDDFNDAGITMEITSYDKKGEANSHTIMTEYKEESTVKNLGGYTVTSLVTD